MNSLFQYIIEVSVGLILFYAVYYWLLRNEACLDYRRFYLLVTPILSLLLPLLRLPNFSTQPALSYSLDFVSVSAISGTHVNNTSITWNAWDVIVVVYLIGTTVLLLAFIWRIGRLLYVINRNKFPRIQKNGYYIRPTQGALPSFTFFNHLFLDDLNIKESDQSIVKEHELVHIRQKHTYDVLFLELLKIFLWFNPVSWWYRKALQSTHECIADAQVVETVGLEKYMEVLAAYSLPKQYHSLAHHLNVHSTLNRIAMLKQLNRKVSFWKYLLLIPGLVGLILFQACQEDVGVGIESLSLNKYSITAEGFTLHVTKNSEEPTKKVKTRSSVHVDGNGVAMLRRWQGEWTFEIRGLGLKDKDRFRRAAAILNNLNLSEVDYNLVENQANLKAEFSRLALNTDNIQHQANNASPEEVFQFVENQPQPKDGMDKFYQFIGENMKYPQQARRMGIEGKVFVQFVVDTDGSLADFQVMKGIGAGCDEEAINVIKMAAPWVPGTQRGKSVKVRMTLPVIFKLN